MKICIFIIVIAVIGIFNYVSAKRENKKTFAALKNYLLGHDFPEKVVIDNEKGSRFGRIQFIGGQIFYYNDVVKNENNVILLLQAAGIKDIKVSDHEYGLPAI